MKEILETVPGMEGWASGGHLADGRESRGQHYFVNGVALCTTGTRYDVHHEARWLAPAGADLYSMPLADESACDICKISTRSRPWMLANQSGSDSDVLTRITRAFRRIPLVKLPDRIPPEENMPERVAELLEELASQLELAKAHHDELNHMVKARQAEDAAIGNFLRRALPELELLDAFIHGQVATKATDLAK